MRKKYLAVISIIREQYGVVTGFILPALLIIVPIVMIALFIARNSESCKQARARGETCPSIWRTGGDKK
jgi:hypothetical protein